MTTSWRSTRRWLIAIAIVLAAAPVALAQSVAKPAGAPTTTPAKTFKAEELEQIVAPIALYPDALLSQVLMASTYPVEVVMAQRWLAQNKSLKGDALTKALEQQAWDPTVKSLVNFPDTLTMMSEKLDWTIKLGDAFIAQQKEVLTAVQKLRTKAQAAGNLESNDKQKVTVAPASTTQPSSTTQVITIESTNPQVIYVPTYNPTVVYGTWSYPSYPPYYYYPPSYTPGPGVWFGAGLALGAAWGYAWGGCDWHGGDVDIDIDRNTNINRNIDRDKYKQQIQNRQGTGGRTDKTSFQHDPSHRRGVSYRDQGTAQKFGGASPTQAIQSRDAYRGRADAGTKDIAKGGVQAPKAGVGTGSTPRPTAGNTAANRPTNTAANRPATPSNSRYTAGSNTYGSSNTRSSFSGAQSSSRATQSASNRGSVSRSSGGGTRSTPVRSSGGGGGSRSGGGGGRRR